jgi:hypothetical protein
VSNRAEEQLELDPDPEVSNGDSSRKSKALKVWAASGPLDLQVLWCHSFSLFIFLVVPLVTLVAAVFEKVSLISVVLRSVLNNKSGFWAVGSSG